MKKTSMRNAQFKRPPLAALLAAALLPAGGGRLGAGFVAIAAGHAVILCGTQCHHVV